MFAKVTNDELSDSIDIINMDNNSTSNANSNINESDKSQSHRFILFENWKFFCEKIVHFKNLGKSLLTQRYSILYIVGITKES